MQFRRKLTDPLASRRLMCAYCISDYLEWERDPREGDAAPPLNPAVTVLPATVEGQMGGAALCAVHLRPMLRIRRVLSDRPRERSAGVSHDGATPAQRDAPLPRIMPEAAGT